MRTETACAGPATSAAAAQASARTALRTLPHRALLAFVMVR